MRLRILVLSGVLSLALATPSAAVTINLSAILDGAQANAGSGTGSPGTGLGTITFDTTTNVLTWNVTWSGLIAPVIAAHFHGPALPTQNAGIQVTISAVSPSIGNFIISAPQAARSGDRSWFPSPEF